jgi:hypothetical protein
VDFPETERDSRPDTERRDFEECEDVREEPRPVGREPALPCELLPPVLPLDTEPTRPPPEAVPPAGTTGARPQVSQYSSPPPMSSYVPSQSGR